MGLFKRRLQSSGLCRLDNCNNSERSSRRFIKSTNEAPYQMIGERTLAATLGYKELSCGHFWLSLLSECLSCYLYVFIVCSTRISWTGAIIGHEPNLLAMSLSSGIAMMILIFTFRTVHVNPALTISFLLTGRIPIVRATLYILVHCIGSVAAIAFLYSISVKGHAGALGLDNPHEILYSWQILIVETVISFVVTLATYATCNYSSYACARKLVLEQLGNTSSLFASTRDNVSAHSHSRRSVVPIVPQLPTHQPNFRHTLHQTKGNNLLNSYHNEEANYDYEYDNHRIYATQQQSKSESSSQVPIEEIMQDECQLLAPNGFSLHVTSGQAFVIGLAYTLTSLSGIPASGASLNPARSFGPAFIMNRWDRHWIYWLGPILGAVIAGFFYEFIFSPTRKSSLCYRPKLFRFSAHDMAKVGSKSRLYQHQQQKHSSAAQPSATIYRPQTHHQPPIHHSPSTRAASSNLITGSSLLKSSSRDPQLITTSTSVAHLQPSYPISSIFDQMNYLQHQQQQQQQQHLQTPNLDRSKSTAIINSIAVKQHQSTMNLPQTRNNADLALNIDHSRPIDQGSDQVVYDDPNVDNLRQFRTPQQIQVANHRRSFISPNMQQRFEFGLPPTNITTTHSSSGQSSNLQGNTIQNRKQLNDISSVVHKAFNTVHSSGVRPHSVALDHQASFQQHHHHQQQQQQRQFLINGHNSRQFSRDDEEQLDDDLYNILSESREDPLTNGRPQSNEPDYSNNINAETSDSSQRTNEMLPCTSSSDRPPTQLNSSSVLHNARPRDYSDDYYN